MPNKNRRRNGHRERQIRARLKAIGDPCGLCGQAIDYDLPSGHPHSFEADHIVPISRQGSSFDFSNIQAAHRQCNQRKGDGRRRSGKAPKTLSEPIVTSREW